MRRCMRYPAAAFCAAGLALARVLSAGAASARTASTRTAADAGQAAAKTVSALPVTYSFATGFAGNFAAPAASPPGANNFSCHPGAAHPYPVVLVHGTFGNMNDNWQRAAPGPEPVRYPVTARRDRLVPPLSRGRSSMVEPQPSKLVMPVRSRSPAPSVPVQVRGMIGRLLASL